MLIYYDESINSDINYMLDILSLAKLAREKLGVTFDKYYLTIPEVSESMGYADEHLRDFVTDFLDIVFEDKYYCSSGQDIEKDLDCEIFYEYLKTYGSYDVEDMEILVIKDDGISSYLKLLLEKNIDLCGTVFEQITILNDKEFLKKSDYFYPDEGIYAYIDKNDIYIPTCELSYLLYGPSLSSLIELKADCIEGLKHYEKTGEILIKEKVVVE